MVASYIYVSKHGNDTNPGTKQEPFYSLKFALEQLRRLRSQHKGTIKLLIADGTYEIGEPLIVGPELSGTAHAPTFICAEENAAPIISGGQQLQLTWRRHDERLFVAEIPSQLVFTQLYVNGNRAHLCRYPNFSEDEVLGGYSEDCLSAERIASWSKPVGGYVHGLSHHRWGSVHYRIDGVDDSGELKLTGGDQINRDSRLHEQFRFVENIFEELDSPNEWFLDQEKGLLYYYPAEDLNIEQATFTAVIQKRLIDIHGSMNNPVRHVHIEGLTFTHTARTIMEPYEPLLRGDWSIVRNGAVMLTGAEDCSVQHCKFEQLGGNAFFVNEYNRRVRFSDNQIRHCGDSGIALVGHVSAVRSPRFWDSTDTPSDMEAGPNNGNYPMDCLIDNNLIHHIGEFGKQTAGVFISMSESIVVQHNTIYHVPRAAVCINDGCWGGHSLTYNDIFDTVRETHDHGPINAWGRDRFWSKAIASDRNPDRLSKLDHYKESVISNNRLREFHVSFGIDLDDGCSNYTVANNLCIGTSIKLREGYDRSVFNNILFGVPLRKGVCYPANDDVVTHNIIVRVFDTDVWNGVMGSPSEAKQLDYNLFYCYSESEPVFCARSPREEGIEPAMTLEQWQNKGFDKQSLIADPCFQNPEQLDFRLMDHSPAFQLGFKPFPIEGFGVTYAEQSIELQRALEQFIPKLQAALFTEKQATNSLYTFAVRSKEVIEWQGASLKNVIGEEEVTFTGLSKETGVIVTATNQLNSLLAGDVILVVNGQPIDTVKDFRASIQSGSAWTLEILRSQTKMTIQL